MRIKLLKSCLVSGFGPDPVHRNNVIESNDTVTVNEFKSLVAIGYAAETTDKVTVARKVATATTPVKAPAKPATKGKGDAPENKTDEGGEGEGDANANGDGKTE